MLAGAASLYETYTYRLPQGGSAGDCLIVPFSSGQALGYIVELLENPDVDETGIKAALSFVETECRLETPLFDLARMISEMYVAPLPRAVRTVLPGMMRGWLREEIVLLSERDAASVRLTPAERAVVESLARMGGSASPRELRESFPHRTLSRLLPELSAKRIAERRFVLDPPRTRPKIVRAATLAIPEIEVKRVVAQMGRKLAKRNRALQACANSPAPVPLDRLRKLAGCSDAAIKPLVANGLLRVEDVPRDRLPGYIPLPERDFGLSSDQTAAVAAGLRAMSAAKPRVLLIHGVTASGKTEVYMQLIERAVVGGRGAVMLLPEIALTAQAVDVFKTRFGEDVAVLHSGLSVGERYDEWLRLRSGRAKIALGPRSAVLAPVRDLALIVVDEEQDTSYKQMHEPRYHARDLAVWRAHKEGAAAVLGSATPSVESFYRAQEGVYDLAILSKRIEDRPLPDVVVADMREERSSAGRSIFSSVLREAIDKRLDANEQVILLQNRRAYAAFLLCRECGHVPRCTRCAVALRYHRGRSAILCHHCGYQQPAPSSCPSCGGARIAGFGIGTERVEEEVKTEFPQARVLRMDRDTTARKGAHADMIRAFRAGEAHILIGTQMVAKGLDFAGVTLVGVISADTAINLPDFRAAERSYQLLAQVAGRSGRGDKPGQVIVQTFEPEHHAVTYAAAHDYSGFYNHELNLRRELGYPPFSYLANVTASSGTPSVADRLISDAAQAIETSAGGQVELLGPAPCAIEFLRGEYRRHILLRAGSRETLTDVLNALVRSRSAMARGLEIDMDPVWMV